MITGIEIPYLFAILYPGLNDIWWLPKIKPDVEKEVQHEPQEMDGVEIYHYHTGISPPTYINVNNIMLPVGGGTFTEKRLLLTKHISKDKQRSYLNFCQHNVLADRNKSFIKTIYINNNSDIENIFNYYNIPVNQFAINLPLEINYYNYKQGFYIHRIGLIASSREVLVKEVLWRKRLPLTLTIPVITVALLCGSWGYYWPNEAYKFSSYNEYYPPFHYKRILNYFK